MGLPDPACLIASGTWLLGATTRFKLLHTYFPISSTVDTLEWIVVWTAILVAIGAAVYYAAREVAPKFTAIVATTAKESLLQPLFLVVLLLGIVALWIFPFIPYNTFGDDIKMLKTSGLTTIKLLSIFLALWTASVSIADEIEGRTALTLLSKPVSRRQFILGKFVGILVPVGILFLVLGVVFLTTVSYKLPYDARESSKEAPKFEDCLEEVQQIVPGLAISFLEVIVLTAISVAISTRLPMLPNLTICASVYALGHLLPLLVQSTESGLEMVRFVAQLIAVVLPNLDHFNVGPSVFTGQAISLHYLGWTLGYCLMYTSFALVAALLLFEDRDLA